MSYQVLADDGTPLDAHFDVDGNAIIFHSRGGSKEKNPRSIDYSAARRLLLTRLAQGRPVQRAWVDSLPVQQMSIENRVIADGRDRGVQPVELARRMSSRMQAIGRERGSKAGGGNSSKRIRLQLSANLSHGDARSFLKSIRVSADFRREERLPASDLQKVSPEHLYDAVQKLLSGFTDHDFGESTDFDVVLEDGTRLAPKAVFGLAATEALGFKVGPRNFSAETSSACFRILTRAGYKLVPKGAAVDAQPEPDPIDPVWPEGTKKYKLHLRRERSPSMREAKKAEFRRTHKGQLFCERCGEDPVKKYRTQHAESCIEVHHAKTAVAKMQIGHFTRLEDLQCLCANCHRLTHREMRESSAA